MDRSLIKLVNSWIWVAVVVSSIFDPVLLIPGWALFDLAGASVARLLLSVGLLAAVVAISSRPMVSRRLLQALVPMGAWTLFVVVSLLWSELGADNWRYVTWVLVYFVILVATTSLATDRRYRTWIYYAPLLISLGFATIEMLSGFRLSAFRQEAFPNAIVGPYVNPLFLAFVLCWYAPGLLYRVLEGSLRKRWGTALLYLGCVVFVVTSTSRTGLIGLIVGSALAAAFSLRHLRRLLPVVALVGGLAFGAYYAVDTGLVSRLLPAAVSQKLSTTRQVLSTEGNLLLSTSRGHAISVGLGYFLESPILGGGPGAAEQVLGQDGFAVLMQNTNPHNWWLELLLNGGIVSFLLFGAAYLHVTRRLFRVLPPPGEGNRDDPVDPAMLFLGMCVFPILVFGPSSLINTSAPWVFFGLSLGTMVSLEQERAAASAETKWPEPVPAVGLTAGGRS